MTGFQTTVNYQPGAAVAGDFASNNPRSSVLAGPGGLIAGTNGLTIGTFCWLQTDGVTVLQGGSGVPAGFLSRQDMNAVITTYLAESGFLVPAGFGVTLYNAGDFWAVSTTVAVVGQKVFAVLATGAINTNTSGATVTGSIETPFYVASASGAAGLFKFSSKIV